MAETSYRNTLLAWQRLQIEIHFWHGIDFRYKYIAGMAETSDRNTLLAWQRLQIKILAWHRLQIEIHCWHGRDFRLQTSVSNTVFLAEMSDCCLEELRLIIQYSCMAETSDYCLEELQLVIQNSCQTLQSVVLKNFI
jgi:hypothetical protein